MKIKIEVDPDRNNGQPCVSLIFQGCMTAAWPKDLNDTIEYLKAYQARLKGKIDANPHWTESEGMLIPVDSVEVLTRYS